MDRPGGQWVGSPVPMVVCPCSTGSLSQSRLARNNLIERRDVALKERRPLILVPREAPVFPDHVREHAEADSNGGGDTARQSRVLSSA